MSKEIKVAIMTLVAAVILYFGFNFLKGSDFFKSSRDYYALYDSVDGLTASNQVTVNGVTVGHVKEIHILTNQNNRILVTLSLDEDIPLNDSSRAILADNGLLGGKVIQLAIGHGKGIEPGDTLLTMKQSGLSAALQEKALPVVTDADSLIRNLNVVASRFKQTGDVLNQLLSNVDQTGLALRATINENRQSIASIMGNLNRLSAQLAETEKGIKPLMTKANTFADSLNALQLGRTVAKANQTVAELQQMLQNVKNGQGTAGKLLNDTQLYTNLNQSVKDLDKLLVDLRQQPKRYVHFSLFGGKKGNKSAGDTLGTGEK
ncbi:MAG: MlaD family protein [Siphonobacter sp.]